MSRISGVRRLILFILITVLITATMGCSSAPAMSQQEVEYTAIKTLVKLMDAYNSKESAKIKAIDLRTRGDSDQEVDNYWSKTSNFVLKDVQNINLKDDKIIGRMLYTNEINNSGQLGKNVNIAYTNFTIARSGNNWVLVAASPVDNPQNGSMELMMSRLKMLDAAKQKYGVDNLSKWEGIQ